MLLLAVSCLAVFPAVSSDVSLSSTHIVETVYASADCPYIIEGLAVASDGHGIVVRNCEHVVIRNCTVHHCAYDADDVSGDINAPGTGILVENCSDISIEGCEVAYNHIGIHVRESTRVTISGVESHNNLVHGGILLQGCTDCLVEGNSVHDNGREELFYGGDSSRRAIGIYVVGGSDIEIAGNSSVGNSSDGISVVGQDYYVEDQADVWKTTVSRVLVHDNYIAGNLEQGIWSCRSRDCLFFGNEIHMSCSDIGIGVGIAFEFDVDGAEVYGNTIYPCKVPHGAGATVSHDNYFHDNTLYTYEDVEFFLDDSMISGYDYADAAEKSLRAGMPLSPSSGNVSARNTVIVLGEGAPVVDPPPEQPSCALLLEGIHASPKDPYVVEGRAITSDGDGLVIRDCENIVVRNCTITGCAYTEENIEPDCMDPGMAVRIDGCDGITLEGCDISYNLMGMWARDSSGITVSGCTVSNSVYFTAIRLDNCTDCLITGNTVEDNGFPERFHEYGGGKRIIGLNIIRGSDIEISHNTIARNTSDGILIGGQDYMVENPDDVWKTIIERVTVHDNYLADNHEQGIWVARAYDCQFYNNEIHVDCSDIGIGCGFCFEIDVLRAEVWGNVVYACKVPAAIEIAMSHDNNIYDNILYTFEEIEFCSAIELAPGYDTTDDRHKSKLAGLAYAPSSGNVSENNTVIVAGPADTACPADTADASRWPYYAAVAGLLLALLAVTLVRRR